MLFLDNYPRVWKASEIERLLSRDANPRYTEEKRGASTEKNINISEKLGSDWHTVDKSPNQAFLQRDTTVTLEKNLNILNVGGTPEFIPSYRSSVIHDWTPRKESYWPPNENNQSVSFPNENRNVNENINIAETVDSIFRLAGLLAQSINQDNNRKLDRQRLPTSAGTDTEDRSVFIKKMEQELRRFKIAGDEWFLITKTQLKGEAAQWVNHYGQVALRWDFL
ncbi:hypothetical protein JTB14_015286 [Gonioctena quinquepunctata]|nr:hypothetical protein JTB14_015286 [Gonioctena quinquepunctata]